MATVSYQISTLLEKMGSVDKDYRFMAANDLLTELRKDNITLDDDTERKVVTTLLTLLEDKNGEVQNLAVRCLAPLANKIDFMQLGRILEMLCFNMTTPNEQLCDVSSIALKTVIAEMPPGVTATTTLCVKTVVPRLTTTLCKGRVSISVKLECLDILSNVIVRYGRICAMGFDQIEEAVFMYLDKERQALRKRAIITLGHLADAVQSEQFDRIVRRMLDSCLQNANSIENLRIYIAATTNICRSSGARFSFFLDKFVPLFIDYCEKFDDDELKEACLQAFETFICRCTVEVTPFLDSILALVAKLIAYDPNYQYDDDEIDVNSNGMNNMDTDENVGEDDDDDQNEYSDDDDLSWKVRRAAAKCVETVITYHADKLYENYVKLGMMLIKRFKEREENVKYDIFQAYSALLKQTARFYPDAGVPNQNNINTMMVDAGGPSICAFEKFIQEEEADSPCHKIYRELANQTPSLVKAVYTQIKSKNLKTRYQCFTLLSNLLIALPNSLENFLHLLIGPVQQAINDKLADGNVKINCLNFILVVLNTHKPETIYPFVGTLTPLVVSAVQDPFYKIASEAIAVAQLLIRILHTPPDASIYASYVTQLYEAIIAKLKISDIDQEVKEKAIAAAGLLVSVFADQSSIKLTECLPLLVDRLRNEMTRIVAVKAFHLIVTSSLKINLSDILPDLLQLLSEFLRKNQRTLRILTLTLLDALVARYPLGGLENANLLRVVKETPTLISENDLQISLLSIIFITDVINAYPDQISDSLGDIFTALIRLTQSSLLHGQTLNASLRLYEAIIRSPLPNKPSYEEVVDRLSSVVYGNPLDHTYNRQAYVCIAKAIAVITKTYANIDRAAQLIGKLRQSLITKGNDVVRFFAILTVGELGRIYYDAFSAPSLGDDCSPEKLIMNSFDHLSEDIKSVASYSLGCLAIGNMERFLPFLLNQIKMNPKHQYQLLLALKEVISNESLEKTSENRSSEFSVFTSNISNIWIMLVKHSDCQEEGIRNFVAECLGKICVMDAVKFLPSLLEMVKNESSRVRRTAVNALRFMIVDHPLPMDDILRANMAQFLSTIRDSDLQVRRTAIVTFNSAAHNKPRLLRDCLGTLLPDLYSETSVKPDLIHEVEMGPFKHIVDDGLDLRKAAFECMYTLSNQLMDKIDVFEYMSYMEKGLVDQHDIKLLTFLMLIRLSKKCPIQLIQRLDTFCELIKPQLNLRPKANAVKQENDRQDELKRAAVRACIALRKLPNSEGCQKLSDLFDIIETSAELRAMRSAVERDTVRHFHAIDYMDTSY